MATITHTETNRDAVAAMYDAANRGDMDGFLGALSPDVVVFEPAFLPYGGTYRGIDGMQTLLGRVGSIYDIGGMVVEHLVADGDRVIGLIRMPIIGTASSAVIAEMSMLRDGKIAEMHIFLHDAGTLLDR